MRKIILMVTVAFLSLGLKIAAAENTPAPYLYYYSRMLGGLIIERADGTDSRLIGADVIPPGTDGLRGLGWSPSGRYFLATGINYGDGGHSSAKGIYLLDTKGNQPIPYMAAAGSIYTAQWSPDGSDKVMIVSGMYGEPYGNTAIMFRLVDPSAGRVLAEFEATLAWHGIGGSKDFIWDFDARQVIFYIVVDPEIPDQRRAFRVTINFDGTVLKEPLTEAEYNARPDVPDIPYVTDIGEAYNAADTSPSGRYHASRHLLQDMQHETDIQLPTHSQETICRKFFWSADEQYIITASGTLVAGGGCGTTVLGVTDSRGKLWRELGGCSWDVPPCVSWLPPQVDVNSLPSGQPRPIQLDPVAYEPTDQPHYFINSREAVFQFRCIDKAERHVVDKATDVVKFTLHDNEKCPFSRDVGDEGVSAVAAYDPTHQLLATSIYSIVDTTVSVWRICPDSVGVRILRLNSYGLELEFTPDNKQLRARNVNAWKIYDVDDMLASATAQCETATS